MPETKTDPSQIAAFLIEEHEIRPDHQRSVTEEDFIEMLITDYVKRLDDDELFQLIIQTENVIAKPSEFMAIACMKKLVDPESEWLELFQCEAEFILARALETQFTAVPA